jgi:hypothetical protein
MYTGILFTFLSCNEIFVKSMGYIFARQELYNFVGGCKNRARNSSPNLGIDLGTVKKIYILLCLLLYDL